MIGAAGVVMFVGCGASGPEIVPVTGEVHFNGQPVADADVLFAPDSGRPAVAHTDETGQFQLKTRTAGDGASVGHHHVVITKSQQVDPNDTSPYPEMKSVLPPKYGNPSLSGLTADVTADGENHFRFELTD
ncbi:MAG: hypothetical protein KDA42_13605 [Planctomycetales bacterium]|nr:hypothetical protein [Planctomycetales bacterium]